MSSITIFRGSYHRGRSVLEKPAQRRGYQCLSRILIEAFDEFDHRIPEKENPGRINPFRNM